MKPYTFCRKSLLIALSIISTVTFTSCQKDFPPIFKDGDGKSGKPVVLVAGYESNGVNNVAKFWINDEEVILSDGTNDAEAYSIFVKGNNTYVAGTDSGQPVYWYNNTEIRLPVKFTRMYPFHNSSANSIFIKGNDTYIAGNDSTRAVYWKNGTEIILDITNAKGNFDYSTANSVFISGNDIYVAGTHGANAVYWKNGVEVYLTNLSTDVAGSADANSIYVSGGNVYIVGNSSSISQTSPLTNYWINGIDEAATLNNSNFEFFVIHSVFVSGNNIYIGGAGKTEIPPFSGAVYWNNGNVTALLSNTNNIISTASSIYVKGNGVYLSGFDEDTNHQIYAVYWKNGTEVKLTDGTRNAFATSIFIK